MKKIAINSVEYEEINEGIADRGDVIDVTIMCFTYNHAKYIADCLEGFIQQKTKYIKEIIVVDDASCDGTSDIIRQYADRYPNLIHAFIAKTNTFHKPDRIAIVNRIRQYAIHGRYIALCEGDDFWIDRHKLQLQIDYMESHKECSMTLHNCLRVDFSNDFCVTVFDEVNEDKYLNLEDILFFRCRGETSSMVYRREYDHMDDIFNRKDAAGDWKRKIYCSIKGNVFYFDRVMSVYRCKTEGSWSMRNGGDIRFRVLHDFSSMSFLSNLDRYTNHNYQTIIAKKIQQLYGSILYSYKFLKKDIVEDLYTLRNEKPDLKPFIEEAIRERLLKQGKDDTDRSVYRGLRNQYKYVFIWGTGNGSRKLSECLEKCEIKIDGYAVSDKEAGYQYRGMTVKRLDELHDEYSTQDLLVLVGILTMPYDQGVDILKEYDIKHFYFPFIYNLYTNLKFEQDNKTEE